MTSAEPPERVECFAGLDAMPEDAARLFARAGSFFTTRAWWEMVLAQAMPAGAEAMLLVARVNGAAAGLLPMSRNGGFRALTTPYTCVYEPLIADSADRGAVLRAFARFYRRFSVTRLDALDASGATEIAGAARSAGLAAATFDHFGNWHEDVTGLDWPAWLTRRPGALRETIRRRMNYARRLTDARFEMFASADDIAAGIAAFETVYAHSWKSPEPFLGVNPAQIRAAASLGLARVGAWWVAGTPVAAQFWLVERGVATLLKLAHDEASRALSPGTVLTAWMIRHMIEQERVVELDFGRGDDDYKQGWVSSRRQRVGLLLINPLRPRGLATLMRHQAGRAAARFRPVGRAWQHGGA